MQQQKELSFSELLIHIRHSRHPVISIILGQSLCLTINMLVTKCWKFFFISTFDAFILGFSAIHPELTATVGFIYGMSNNDYLTAYIVESTCYFQEIQTVSAIGQYKLNALNERVEIWCIKQINTLLMIYRLVSKPVIGLSQIGS